MEKGEKKLGKGFSNTVIRLLRRTGIYRRLILVFLLLTVFSTIFITFFSYQKYVAEIETNIEKYTSLLVSNAVMRVEDNLRRYEKNAIKFYDNDAVLHAIKENTALVQRTGGNETEVYDANRTTVGQALHALQGGDRFYKNIQFVTPDEQYYMLDDMGFRRGGCIKNLEAFYSSDFYLDTCKARGYPVWFDTVAQTTTFYRSEQSVYGISDTLMLSIAVYDTFNREFLGVLIFNIDLSAFTQSLESYSFYDNGNTYLIGSDNLLFGINPNVGAPAAPTAALLAQMRQNALGTLQADFSGAQTFIAYQKIPATSLYVAHLVEQGELLQNALHIRNLCILLVAGLIVICVVVAYFTTISITRPVDQLIHSMNDTQRGRWNRRYDSQGHDEITFLGNKFNEMTRAMEDLIEQVYVAEIKQKRVELSKKDAELDALQMQINPHFLYNTLDIIRWEAMYEADGPSRVSNMIESFSRLLRMGMKADGDCVTLHSSIEHAQLYLKVINFRHSNKIELQLELSLDPTRYYIPQFTIQPILENAVVHGFDDEEHDRHIHLSAALSGEDLIVEVRDNGKGILPEHLEQLRVELACETAGESIGMRNVNQRIKLYYGEQYGIAIDSTEGAGTVVQLRLPAITQRQDVSQLMIAQEGDEHHV